MGAVQNVVDRLRRAFVMDKERGGDLLARGSTSPTYPDSGYDLLQAYGYDALSDYLRLEHDLLSRYVDYEEMDDYPEIASAVDVYADDASQPDTQLQRTVWITSPDKTLQGVLDDLFFIRLRMDEEIWELTRSLVKYGNDYEEILVTQEGVVGMNFLPAPTVRRVEGPRGELYGFVQDFRGRFGYCLAEGSRVWGVGGLQQIETFEAGRQVVGLVEGQQKPLVVRQRHSNGTKRVFRLRTLHRQVFLTEDHPVLVQDVSGARTWTKVRDLRIVRQQGGKKNLDYTKTSKIVISTRMAPGEIPEWSSVWKQDPFDVAWGDKGTPTKLNLPKRPTEDFCRLFGFMLGDGWTEDRKAYYARGEYPELNDYYDGLLRGLGLEPSIRSLPAGGEQTTVSSVQFCRLLDSLGWINGAGEKRIPAWMFALPEGHREALLKGFLDADGWESRQPGRRLRHFFEIANYDLARDLKNLIDGLGYICGNISSRTREPGTVIHGKTVQTQQPCFTVSFTDEKFAEPFVAEAVLKIEYFEDAEVFDLEVDDDAHNFVADGVVVHNSPQEFQKLLMQRTDSIRSMMQPGGSTMWQGGGLLQQVSALETWEVAHFRLRGKHRRSVYGYSVLEPARWIWKRLMLLEDAAMIYRLQRAPERYAFYVDVGDLPPGEALAFVNKMRQQHRKKRFVNPSTGKLDLKFDPLSQDEDFWVPVRKGVEGTRIEVLGGPSWQHMEDVEYFQNKLFSALKVPKAYLAQDENVARAVLSSEDVRFARSVLRVQREVKNGLAKVARTHLAALNIDPYATEYSIHMTVPSAIFELAQLEVRNARADLASRMREHVSLPWVLKNVYLLSDDDIETIIRQRSEDTIREGKAAAEVEKMSGMAQAEVEKAKMPPPGMEGESTSDEKALRGLRLLERKLATQPLSQRRPISEEELFREGRGAGRGAEKKLDTILKSNGQTAQRIKEMSGLLHDLAVAARRG
jgi:hypothetical protein